MGDPLRLQMVIRFGSPMSFPACMVNKFERKRLNPSVFQVLSVAPEMPLLKFNKAIVLFALSRLDAAMTVCE